MDIDFKRKIQKSYPNINGLWTLLWATGFLVADAHGKKVVLKIDEKMLESWEELNAVERYFILMETWLVYTSNESTGRGHLGLGSFSKVSMFMSSLPDKGLQVAGNSEVEGHMIPYRIEAHNLAMLGMFGLVSIDSGPANPGEGWNIIRVKRTAFGEALFDLFRMRLYMPVATMGGSGEQPFGGATARGESLREFLHPVFPEWKNTLEIPAVNMTNGNRIFKVSVDRGVWRRLGVGATSTLGEFASRILMAFDFDEDHLYEFLLRDRYGIVISISHPFCEDEISVDEVTIGELPLLAGHAMRFHYDFGDDWIFNIVLEKITQDDRPDDLGILDVHGDSPEQYPDSDDSW